jgi:hypothetical protein
MQQQVNLYHPMFRKQEKVFSARTLLQTLMIILVGLVVFSAYTKWQVNSLENELSGLEKQASNRTAQIERLTKQLPPKRKDSRLQQEVDELAQEVDIKQKLVTALSQSEFGDTGGFSAYLEGLSRQHLAGMWLKHIDLSKGGNAVNLHGSTYHPELVPQYLQRLSGESVFAGKTFNSLVMQRSAEQGWVDFDLKSQNDKDSVQKVAKSGGRTRVK